MIDRRIDVGIITIIPTEIKALLSTFGIREEFQYSEQSKANYLKTNMYSLASGRDISVVITFLNKEAGNTESAITTSRFLRDWYPRLMCLVGISAGISGKSKIGDVILPAKIQDRQIKVYQNGKYSLRTTSHMRTDFMDGLIKRHGIDLAKFRALCKNELSTEISDAIAAGKELAMNSKNLNEDIDILDGSLVSDNVLIRDSQFFDKVITEVDEKCRGAEMEAAGFVRVCEVENTPWIISRGVSDFGDAAKSDTFQVLAAKTACLALRELLTNYLSVDKFPVNSRAIDFETTLEFNIIQQIRTAHNKGHYDEVCKFASILRPLSRYLWLSGQHQLRIEIGEIVVNAAGCAEENKLRAAYLIDDLGWTTFSLNSKDEAKAKSYIRDGLMLAKELKDYYLSAKAHRHLAGICLSKDLLDEAKKELALAVVDADNIVDTHEKNEMIASLKFAEAKLLLESESVADKKKSVVAFENAFAAFNANSDENRAVKVYVLLGNAHQALGHIVEAQKKYEEGLGKAYKIGRYDEIKSNTNALLSIVSDATRQTDLLKKIMAHCEMCQLYSELSFWQKRYKEIKHEK
jgi:nucleoside phosphorylase